MAGNSATITEDPNAAPVMLVNDWFAVGPIDTALTFDYNAVLDHEVFSFPDDPVGADPQVYDDSFVFTVRSSLRSTAGTAFRASARTSSI